MYSKGDQSSERRALFFQWDDFEDHGLSITTMSALSSRIIVAYDEIVGVLKNYSRALRRDFLGNLVRITAKTLGKQTVRNDWRTREGMFNFLQQHWEFISKELNEDTFIKWYCSSFEQAERVLSEKSFVLFLRDHWLEYNDTFKTVSTVQALSRYSSIIAEDLKNKKLSVWPEDPILAGVKVAMSEYLHTRTNIAENSIVLSNFIHPIDEVRVEFMKEPEPSPLPTPTHLPSDDGPVYDSIWQTEVINDASYFFDPFELI